MLTQKPLNIMPLQGCGCTGKTSSQHDVWLRCVQSTISGTVSPRKLIISKTTAAGDVPCPDS